MIPLLLAAAACNDPAADRENYLAVVQDAQMAPEAGLARCAEIGEEELRGDCALFAATIQGRRDPAAHCPQVPAGVWQDECWFLAAEVVQRRGRDAEAAALCARAGRFSDDCAQHLWQTPVHALIHPRGASAFVAALPEAEALYRSWHPLLAAQSDFEERFWQKFYGNGFEGQGFPVDLGHCAALAGAHRARCREAGAAFYAREIGPAVERAGALAAFCALPSPTALDLAPWLPAAPDPALDAAAASRQPELCRQ